MENSINLGRDISKEELLWENPSPNSDNFNSQTINLKELMSDFKYIKIKFKVYSGSVIVNESVFEPIFLDKYQSSGEVYCCQGLMSGDMVIYSRSIFLDSSNTDDKRKIRFDQCYALGGTVTDNRRSIPLQIYGIGRKQQKG